MTTQTSTCWPNGMGPDKPEWSDHQTTRMLLGNVNKPIPTEWVQTSAARLRNMRENLSESYTGLDDVIDWLLASIVAREAVLLLGTPGVAKSELSTRLFHLLDLKQPDQPEDSFPPLNANLSELRRWWEKRYENERKSHKYFHYLLGRFTQPEELFGPIEISALRQGMIVRVNFGLMSGPGVYAAFLDEVFNASSSILNTLLTLVQERSFFNWGGMERSDLVVLIGASNELPGGFATGSYGRGTGLEDFQTLYAFLDRFPVRLIVPTLSGTSRGDNGQKREALPEESDLAQATWLAIRREASRFTNGASFPARPANMPGVNDILLLGRAMLQHEDSSAALFPIDDLKKFRKAFMAIAADLSQSGTSANEERVTWTISPRKLKAIYKIALAHALITDRNFFAKNSAGQQVTTLSDPLAHLQVFCHIWDAPWERGELCRRTNVTAKRSLGN